MRSKFKLDATLVANVFIDEYMAAASGEYVKVYLYLLRHQERDVEIAEVADALNLTEADIKRAMAYWMRQGVLIQEEAYGEETAAAGGRSIPERNLNGYEERRMNREPADGRGRTWEGQKTVRNEGLQEKCGNDRQRSVLPEIAVQEEADDPMAVPASKEKIKPAETGKSEVPQQLFAIEQTAAAQAEGTGRESTEKGGHLSGPNERPRYTPEQVGRLAGEEEFTQLLYISQKYMNKVFTPRDCEVFAYLYDALHMPAELLEYVVEYCVQGEHYSIRYLEAVALDWHQKGIRTIDMAKQYTASFSDEAYSVMKAFGLNERRPGDMEMDMIRRWFRQWGFTKELVLEACGRTLKATHNPSFSYTDKILSEWKKAGVKVMADVKKLDEKRGNAKMGKPMKSGAAVPKPAKNQFHNFEQRDTNYDEVALERLKQRLESDRDS